MPLLDTVLKPTPMTEAVTPEGTPVTVRSLASYPTRVTERVLPEVTFEVEEDMETYSPVRYTL